MYGLKALKRGSMIFPVFVSIKEVVARRRDFPWPNTVIQNGVAPRTPSAWELKWCMSKKLNDLWCLKTDSNRHGDMPQGILNLIK